MTGAGVVEHEVHVYLDALCVCGVDEVLEIFFRAITGVEGHVVVYVVGVVGVGGMRGGEPQRRNSQSVKVIELVLYTLEIADAVSVAVCEGVDQELVGGRCPLGAVEGGGSRHYVCLAAASLAHAHRSLLLLAGQLRDEVDFRRAVFVGVVGGYGDGAVFLAGCGVQVQPGCVRGGAPDAVGLYRQQPYGRVVSLKGKFCGRYGKGDALFRLVGVFAGKCHQGHRCQQQIVSDGMFHNRVVFDWETWVRSGAHVQKLGFI